MGVNVSWVRWAAAAVLLGAVAGGFSCDRLGGGKSPGGKTRPVGNYVGDRAPDFSIRTLDGHDLRLSDLRGKVVLINFWATWCGPCKAEMPSINRLFQEFRGKGLEVLAIASDLEGEPVVRSFLREIPVEFTVAADDQFEVNNLFEIRVVPTTLLIDQDGVITHKIFGAQDWYTAQSRTLVAKLIETG